MLFKILRHIGPSGDPGDIGQVFLAIPGEKGFPGSAGIPGLPGDAGYSGLKGVPGRAGKQITKQLLSIRWADNDIFVLCFYSSDTNRHVLVYILLTIWSINRSWHYVNPPSTTPLN